MANKQYLSEKTVSEITNKSLSALRNERSQGRGIRYLKVGRSVRYDLDDVIAFMEAHKIETNREGQRA
jgi:hypothetical protein